MIITYIFIQLYIFMNFFNHPIRIQVLPFINHMEHGIKVNKKKVVTCKYNFGCYHCVLDLIEKCLLSTGYSRSITDEIIHYIQTHQRPYSIFGVDNNDIEFYVESMRTIQSWNLKNNVKYLYIHTSKDYAFNMLRKHIPFHTFQLCEYIIDKIGFIYNKTDENNEHIFSFYFMKDQPIQVSIISSKLLILLNMLNKDVEIEEYLKRYQNWYLFWLHISMKQDGSLQITPYFRSKLTSS